MDCPSRRANQQFPLNLRNKYLTYLAQVAIDRAYANYLVTKMTLPDRKQAIQAAITSQVMSAVVCRFSSFQAYSYFFYFGPQGQ